MNTFQEIPASKRSLTKRKLVQGVGINDAEYIVEYRLDSKRFKCPYYLVWVSMLTRCYSTAYHKKRPTYLGCTICEDWVTFSNFKSWMKTQNWQGKELDKDLLIPGNKIYSPDTCIFVSQAINNLILTNNAIRGSLTIGVCWNKQANKFMAKCKEEGKTRHLGYFLTEKDAHSAYILFKKQYISSTAMKQSDLQLKNILLRIANDLQIQQ